MQIDIYQYGIRVRAAAPKIHASHGYVGLLVYRSKLVGRTDLSKRGSNFLDGYIRTRYKPTIR